MKLEIPAYQIQNMAAEEMLKHIPPETLQQIKKTDPHPMFEAYTVAHPGESKTYVVNVGTKILKWLGGILKKIKESILPGTPVFYLHGKDNSHKGRDKIGEIVSTIQNFAGDVVSIVYRFKNFLHLKTDVASFEAPLRIPEGIDLQGHQVQPHEMGEVTGLALANSAEHKPAFEGATRTACLQCLNKEDVMPEGIKLEDVISFIANEKVRPSQIFSDDDILDAPVVKAEIASKKGNENLYYENQRLKAQLQSAKDELAKQKDKFEAEIKEKSTKLSTIELWDTYEKELNSKSREKLTTVQKEFLKESKEQLLPVEGANAETTINSFIDKKIKEFDAWEARFTAKSEKTKDEADDKEKKPKGDQSKIDNEFVPAY